MDRVRLPLALAAPLRAMSPDEAMQRYFETAPLRGGKWVCARFFRTLHAYAQPEAFTLRCPLWLIHPEADAWTPTAMSLPNYDRLTGRKRLRELTNGAHRPIEQPARDELLDEIAGARASLK